MEGTNTILSAQFLISGLISVLMSVGFIVWQYKEYQTNIKAIRRLGRFFIKKEEYSSSEVKFYDGKKSVTNVLIKEVAEDGSELKNLIRDINAYIEKSKGTVAFSIIQNKTERRISMLYEIATSKLSFPTHIGLMGTFAGVFVGLIMFLVGTFCSGGITDSTIQSLISGVLVSMLTSCCGIGMLIASHREASVTSNQVDKDKNEFYEWVQNELMPSVDVSMVEAIGKLHETIDQFEPSFSGVISEFKKAFRDVTGAFGTDFRESVKVVSSAVQKMGENMDKVNKNIRFQDELLTTIRSKELIKGMDAFVEASRKFSEITGSLDQFERARRLMLVAAQETINIQKSFNESLNVPKEVAAEINMILNRITNFENNINKLGTDIAQTQMVGSALVEQIKENITAIKSKQKVAKNFAEVANQKLETYFEEQQVELKCIAKRYNEALETYLSDYEQMLKERKEELENRKREFVEAIEQKLSIEDIRSEFSSLKRLNEITQKLELLAKNPVNGEKLLKMLDGIRTELTAISASQENQSKGILGSIMGSSNTALERLERERQEALREADEARKNEQEARLEAENLRKKEEASQQYAMMAHQRAEDALREKHEKEALVTRVQEEKERERIAMETIHAAQQESDDEKRIIPDIANRNEQLQEESNSSFWSKIFHKKRK